MSFYKFQPWFLSKLYGPTVLDALYLDQILKMAKESQTFLLPKTDNPTHEQREALTQIGLLIDEGMLKKVGDVLTISGKGVLKLSKRGYLGECKKEKNALWAFWVSITALFVSLLAFAFSVLE